MNYKKGYSTWVEIDLIAIEENVRQVRQLTGVSVMANLADILLNGD